MTMIETRNILYRVSRYMDSIKKVQRKDGFANRVTEDAFYLWFNTYEEAKAYLIERAKDKMVELAKEMAVVRKKIPKLEKLTESATITHNKKQTMQKEVVKPEETPSEKPPTVANETPQETEVDVEEPENDSDE